MSSDAMTQAGPSTPDTGAAEQSLPTAIRISNLGKRYPIFSRPQDRLKQMLVRGRKRYYKEYKALSDISLDIKQGESVGIIGRNGCGKSTLLQIIAGTLQPSDGSVDVNGRISALLELGTGFNHDFTGRENVYLNGAILGFSKEEMDELFDRIVEFADIGRYLDQPVKTYSTGMVVRLAFAVSINVDPDILIVDEALAVGDESFQRKCLARIDRLRERGTTILFVSHSARQILQICDRAVLLDKGETLLIGDPKKVVSAYHKLLYSPKEAAQAFRENLLEQGEAALIEKTESEKQSEGADEEIDRSVESYDPGMKPESTLVYESLGAELQNVRLTTLEGKPVNILQHGKRYAIQYETYFSKPAMVVNFGTALKTLDGINVGGASTRRANRPMDFVNAGETVTSRHEFTCYLLEGTYFVNAGVSAIVDGEQIFLHRIADALMFTVLPELDLVANGIVNFAFESDCKLKRPDQLENADASEA
ncbi:ABC transporter ATP-binding protein [Rhodovibrionaceae bacterium A322]